MKTISKIYLLLLIAAFSFFLSCTSTKLVSSWRAPDATVDVNKLSKVWVMCLVKDESTRRVAEDELAKGYGGKYKSAQETADAIAAAWEKITDQIGRDKQLKLYRASLGL